ncbi:MAG: hypothetical protein GW778_01045 [Alphaproteobacteria bacterium]|nr:hypothetical protein [Alphaproteobacteria bacterium]
MNDMSSSKYNAQNVDDNRLLSEHYEGFLDALDLLYIKSNLSGRLKFYESWPFVARYLFGDELIGFDHDGTIDIERRRVLEEEAEVKRLALLELVQTVEAKSVEKSVLQIEYVEALVKKLGREMALLIYAPKIVDRYLPASTEQDETVDDNPDDFAVPKPRPSDIPDEFASAPPLKPIVPDIDDDMDAVQPISVDQPQPEEPASPPPPPSQPLSEPEPYPDTPPARGEHSVSSDLSEPTPLSSSEINGEIPAKPLKTEPEIPAEQSASAEAQSMPPAHEPPQDDIAPDALSPADHTMAKASAPIEASAVEKLPPAPSDPTVQDVSQQAKHKALGDGGPIASQKMTFIPSRPDEPSKSPPKFAGVPVVGEKKNDPTE